MTDDHRSRTGDAPGDEGSENALTGAGADTIRGEYDHEGRPRDRPLPGDEGVTSEAAEELAEADESEPTRSE